MTQERINRIEINWRDLFKPINGLQTGPKEAPVINEVVVKQEIIPIIFVPGIMGSRLINRTTEERAWDPDKPSWMAKKYGFSSPQKRKKRIVGEQAHDNAHLVVDNENAKHNKKIPDGMHDNGWGGVFWGSYGTILKTLSSHEWPEPLHACFHFPVYAFGYNWTATNDESGKELSTYIDNIIQKNAGQGECNQVILVTHSMGGLVARSACMLHKAQGKVLGVVHGVQPATGAPAAYFRMKAGFEPPGRPDKLWDWLRNPLKPVLETVKGNAANRILGHFGRDVTIVMANCPGALELLPNKLYKDNNGSSQWLSYTDHLGKRSDYPRKDPYREIYGIQDPAYRLVNPAWLGEASPNDNRSGYIDEGKPDWDNFILNLNKAGEFHDRLGTNMHPETYQFYATDLETVDRVDIASEKRLQQGSLYFEAKDKDKFIMEIRDEAGEKTLTPGDYALTSALAGKHCLVYSLQPPSGSGDGTVPDSSGRALAARAASYTLASGSTVAVDENDEHFYSRKHDDIYKFKTAKHITLRAIENLCRHKIRTETARS